MGLDYVKMMQIKIQGDYTDSALIEQWDNLARLNIRNGFFCSPIWQLNWWECFGMKQIPVCIQVYDNNKLIGLAPLRIYKTQELPGFPVRALGFLGRDTVAGDFLDFICQDNFKARMADIVLQEIYKIKKQWDIAIFGELIKDSLTYFALQDNREKMAFAIRYQEPHMCPYIKLPETFDSYLSSLSRSMRTQILYLKRRLQKDYDAVIAVNDEVYSLNEVVDSLFILHKKRWQEQGRYSNLFKPEFKKFITKLCLDLHQRNNLKIYHIIVNKKIIAVNLVFLWEQSAIYYNGGWDPEFSKWSPGSILVAKGIEDAILSGKKYYEFLRGDEAYKSRWTQEMQKTETVILAQNLKSQLLLQILKTKNFLKNTLFFCNYLKKD